jgi:transcriptional regulator with XRE-family HTH domain
VRRLTQIDLAVDANVSAKHLCFLETGRSQPSREMVQLLCSALDLPLEERNALHVAAGFVPPYSDKGLAADHLQPVRQALDFILRQQEPYPGIVVDGRWDVRMRNQGSARLLKPFRDSYEMEARVADNAMHVVFHPKGLRQFIVNWDEFAGNSSRFFIATLRKAAGLRRSCSTKSWPIPVCRPNGGCRDKSLRRHR